MPASHLCPALRGGGPQLHPFPPSCPCPSASDLREYVFAIRRHLVDDRARRQCLLIPRAPDQQPLPLRGAVLPRHEVEFVDQPDGVLVVKAGKLARGKRVLAALLRGGKVKGDTESWLRLTRGAA